MSTSVIIGNATTASFGGACVISAQWGFEPGRQDAFCLGDWNPSTTPTIYKPQNTLSLTIYSPGPSYSTTPSSSCADAGTLSASVSPTGCGGGVTGVSGNWHVTSYSYTKDSKDQVAQESWSLVQYNGFTASTPAGNTVLPTTILRGIAQGQATNTASTGISFSSTFASGSSGSVSAGGMGKAQETTHGVVSSVGGGSGALVADIATGSASIPYTPLYI
jgi:hypothetical protein